MSSRVVEYFVHRICELAIAIEFLRHPAAAQAIHRNCKHPVSGSRREAFSLGDSGGLELSRRATF